MSRKPVRKVTSGRISISIWTGKPGQDKRACVQHSRKDKNTGEWSNQQIWLFVDELRDMADALDKMNGEENSPSPSMRVHHIVEYIKANGLDAGLDVYDVKELGAEKALSRYGIHVPLTPDEKQIVLAELTAMAEQREFAEMAYTKANCQGVPS